MQLEEPILLDLAVRVEAAGEFGSGEYLPDLDPGLFHPDLIALLPYDPLQPGQGFRGGLGG